MSEKLFDKDKDAWLRCPECDSRNVLYSKKKKTHWCRKCGAEFTLTRPDKESEAEK